MRVLVGVHHLPPNHFGGAEREALVSARGLQQRGHDVRLVCVEHIDRGPVDGVRWVDDSYEGLAVRRLEMDLLNAPQRDRLEYDNRWIGEHVEQMLRDDRADVFLLKGGYLLSGSVLQAARRAGVPSIVRLTDFWFLCRRITMLRSDGSLSRPPIDPAVCARCLGEESRRYRWPGSVAPLAMRAYWRLRRAPRERLRARLEFLRRQLEGAAAILSPSQFLANVYADAGIDPGKLHFTRQGVDVPAALPRWTRADRLRLGYLGQMTPIKGVDVLLRALRRLPSARLSLDLYGSMGHSPRYAHDLSALAQGDERIAFRGRYQDHGGLTAVLADLDAIVVPSIWWENCPTVILEAYAHGVPVIASDLGGMAELVRHDESGLLFRPGDPVDLATQIARLAADPSLLEVLRAGVPPVKTTDEMIDEIEDLCARVARGAA